MFCWPHCLKLERVCIFSMAIPRKPCWHSFSLLTPAGHSSSTLAHPLVSIKILLFPSKTQTAASESPYQHNIPLNSGRLIWIYFLATVCLNYISAQLAMMSIATKIPENAADWFPMSRKMSFAHVPHALGCHIKRFSLIQERVFFLIGFLSLCNAKQRHNRLIPYMRVWREKLWCFQRTLIQAGSLFMQSTGQPAPPDSVCESVKIARKERVGREIHGAELEKWWACRAAEQRGGGVGTEAAESSEEKGSAVM